MFLFLSLSTEGVTIVQPFQDVSKKEKKNSKNTSLGLKWASRNKGEMAGKIEVSEKLPALWTGKQRSRAQPRRMNNHAMGEKKEIYQ